MGVRSEIVGFAGLAVMSAITAAMRAAVVRRHRVDAVRLTTSGLGESQPKDTNATLEGRARNRRVELMRQ